MKKIIFLDRDGVINVDTGYTYKIEDFQFEKKAVGGLGKLREKGFEFIIVTNQSGIGRGYYSESDYQKFNDYVVAQLEKNGIQVLKSYYSPFHPEGIGKYKKASRCRKPGTGMLEQAFTDFEIDKKNSWMIGDKWADVKAGFDFGIKSILVKTGKGGRSDEKHKTDVAYIAEDLPDAAKFIIKAKF